MDKRYKTYFDITEKEIDKVVKKYKNYETQLKKARSTIEILQKDSIKTGICQRKKTSLKPM